MSDTPTTAQDALAKLRERAAEHNTSKHEADQEYAAGIRDAITALEPSLTDPSTAQEALAKMRERAAEHETSKDEAYQEYAAGIRDAIKALEPFLKAPSADVPAAGKAQSKLSKAQQDVVDRLKEGWALGVTSRLITRRAWLQKDGLGKGGETKPVRLPVLDALVKGKHIVRGEDGDSPYLVYVLPAGGQP